MTSNSGAETVYLCVVPAPELRSLFRYFPHKKIAFIYTESDRLLRRGFR